MPHRVFTDAHNVRWEVWDVEPQSTERRIQEDRRKAERKAQRVRRKFAETRVKITPEHALGWLCFQSASEKRRLAPIPAKWDERTDSELEAMLPLAKASMTPTGAHRRLIE